MTSLLKDSFAYYTGNTIIMNKGLTYGMQEKTVTVKAGDPSASGSMNLDNPLPINFLLLKGGDFDLSCVNADLKL